MKCFEIQIEGKVQGVWFRKYTKKFAERVGIVGTVQNRPDGSVLCVAKGEIQALEEFLGYCRKGSPLSEVKDLSIKEIPSFRAETFEIIH